MCTALLTYQIFPDLLNVVWMNFFKSPYYGAAQSVSQISIQFLRHTTFSKPHIGLFLRFRKIEKSFKYNLSSFLVFLNHEPDF